MKAKNLKPAEREFFLAGLTPREKAEVVIDDDTLLSEIDDFVKRIEGGEYSTGWGWDDEIHDEREWGDESWQKIWMNYLIGQGSCFYQAI